MRVGKDQQVTFGIDRQRRIVVRIVGLLIEQDPRLWNHAGRVIEVRNHVQDRIAGGMLSAKHEKSLVGLLAVDRNR